MKKETKNVMPNKLNLKEVLTKKSELDNVNDLWYFVTNGTGKWVAGSAK